MVDPIPRRTLADCGAAEPVLIERNGVRLREVPFPTLINLRGDPQNALFMAGVERALGVLPTIRPNAVAIAAAISILWLGPDEWLVVAPQGSMPDLAVRLEMALSSMRHAVTDVSASRTVLDVAGPGARAVLATGLSLDLHPNVFGPDRCVQTGLARIPVILQQIDGTPRFRLYLHNSYASYVVAWLQRAMEQSGPSA